MILMAKINSIREMYFMEGLNKSEISRRTGLGRKTIRKYINQDNWNEESPQEPQNKRKSKLDPYKKEIDTWLINDLKARRKQRHSGRRVYSRLKDKYKENFSCGYRIVNDYVQAKKKELYRADKCSLPLEHKAGEAQVDFGHADFFENGTKYDGAYLNLSFPNSNAGFQQLFKGENSECLLEGLKNIFKYIGGVPVKLWFDNTKTIVKKFFYEGKRELTESFLRFKQHYGFDVVFCNPNAGHEKGHVESKVGYHRRNMLVPVPEFKELREFNEELLIKCERDMDREHYRKEGLIKEFFAEDKKHLGPLPPVEFKVARYETVRTDGYGKFRLKGGRYVYSTAPQYTNSQVLIKKTAYEIALLDENHREVVVHLRLYGNKKQESMDWLPYLSQLARRPRALKYTGIYNMLPQELQVYLNGCTNHQCSDILKAMNKICKNNSFKKAVETMTYAVKYGTRDIDSIMAIHDKLNGILPELVPVRLPGGLPDMKTGSVDMKVYDGMLSKGEVLSC